MFLLKINNYYILACKNPKAFGMETGKIKDSQIAVSTSWSVQYGANKTRLNGLTSWISKSSDLNQWLQVDFNYIATVTDIQTQGRGRYGQWVKSYTVSYSDDGLRFKTYQKSGKDKVRHTLFA